MTAAELAETLAMPPSTVSAVLTPAGPRRGSENRGGGGGGGAETPPPPAPGGENPPPRRTDLEGVRRYGVGFEYVHVAVDDHSRLAYAEVLPDQKATTAVGFLGRAVAFYRRYRIEGERVLTDNGSAYLSVLHA